MTHSQRTYAGVPGAARDEGRRRRLLDAALERFATEGYAGSSVEAVCGAAGVSTRNFYDHFANREALLIAIYDEAVDRAAAAVLDAVRALGPGEAPGDYVRVALDVLLGGFVDDPRRAQIAFVEIVGVSPAVEAHRRARTQELTALMRRGAEYLAAAGPIGPRGEVELGVQIAVLIGGVREAIADWLAQPEAARPPRERLLDALVATFDRALS